MNPWRDTAFAFSALPEVGPLLLSATPAWIWSRDGSRVLWANPAGGRVIGVSSFPLLWERRWAESHQLHRAIASLARALPEQGMLARLRLNEDLHSLPVACRCRFVRARAERGVLVSALEGSGRSSSLAELASFFSGPRTDAAIIDVAERMLAESKPGTAAALVPAMPYLEFSEGERTLRLYLVERVPEIIVAAPREIASPSPSPIERIEPILEAPAPMMFEERAPPEAEAPRSADPEVPPPRKPLRTAAALPIRKSASDDTAPSEKPAPRSVMAGRVAQELSRKPVRFLWQTDASDRFLFVSPGLAQVVGRNAEIAGERWQEVAGRLRLDPGSRIARALRQRDTWSGLTAWWPIEGSNVRVPVELTALPVFGGDQSFQGYRGFGILRPAEALMPATFETRFGPHSTQPAEQVPPYEEAAGNGHANVVPIRSDLERITDHSLTQQERNAFEEIAAALRDRIVGEFPPIPRPAEESEPDAEPASEAEAADADQAPSPLPPVVELRQPVSPPPRSIAVEPPARDRRVPVAPAPQTARSDAASGKLGETQRLREMTAILDTATDGVLILDAEGMIESVNGSAEALFGLDAHEMRGRHFGELLTPESRKAALDYLSGLKDSGVASLLNEGREVEAVAGAGTIPLFMTMGRISSDEGGRFCAVLRDITHWKRIEAELLAAKRAAEHASSQKSDFLARVSHEVRTPLNAIIGFAEVMIEERFGAITNERYREYLRDIRSSGEHVVSLVNDLLDISKIEAGRLDLHFAAVVLNDVVRESIGLMQIQANRSRVVLRSSLSRDVPAIVADERTLRQIVLNLLSNSVKFTGPGGQVIASTSLTENGEALLRIRDTGEGMTEEELARALEPFRQLSTAAMSGVAGTGLGLPLTKALVEANRATMTIKSARGEGTVVTITIPPTRVLSE